MIFNIYQPILINVESLRQLVNTVTNSCHLKNKTAIKVNTQHYQQHPKQNKGIMLCTNNFEHTF